MQFLVTGRDGTDEGALERRMQSRAAHIEVCDVLFKSKKLLFGVALTNDEGVMVGSSMVFDTESREELDALLAAEPYIENKVWATVDVQSCNLGPTFRSLYEDK
jgi:uncharacterized protein YciI